MRPLDRDAEGHPGINRVVGPIFRNLYRGDARTFAMDAKALGLADTVIEKGWDRKFNKAE